MIGVDDGDGVWRRCIFEVPWRKGEKRLRFYRHARTFFQSAESYQNGELEKGVGVSFWLYSSRRLIVVFFSPQHCCSFVLYIQKNSFDVLSTFRKRGNDVHRL